jgi:hypothetical protein
VHGILDLRLCNAVYDHVGGSSYDDRCFLYSLLAVSHFNTNTHNAQRATHYKPYLNDFVTTGINFPMKIEKISPFESLNPDYSINVMCFNPGDKTFTTLYASAHRDRKHIANLMLPDDGDRCHCITVRNLSALLKGRNSHHKRTFPCPYCLCCFTTAAVKNRHVEECGKHGLQSVRCPTPENSTLKFSNTQNEIPLPHVLYSDLESYLVPNESDAGSNATNILDTHTPSGFCCFTVSSFPHLNNAKPYVYSGPDVMQHFFSHV